MFPEGPTTTTVAPPFGLAAREYATHASASLRAVSRLISCRCARFVASGDIVTCASVSGGFCGVGSGGLVCADALIAPMTTPKTMRRRLVPSEVEGPVRSRIEGVIFPRRAPLAAYSAARRRRLRGLAP